MAPTLMKLTPRARAVLALRRLRAPTYLTNQLDHGYELFMPTQLRTSITESFYRELQTQLILSTLVKMKFVTNISAQPFVFTMQTSCTAKGYRWADTLPGVRDGHEKASLSDGELTSLLTNILGEFADRQPSSLGQMI